MNKSVQGKWLEDAFKALGVTAYKVCKQLEQDRPDKYYQHFKGRSFLNSESLAELARLYPKLNIRYILTGEDSPLLP
ncbi:hypothetical protein HNV11_22855 [Spirosoma taeanense]|uniref:Helix-turn-helix transcriptional regulator n=1 Tax=Spirosoma taeanense TaxID=2735870 RepID=A0A6M5YDF6_9BACT|nr:hypothetical protein [Spirosoma taeanense]QJW92019.1 hypothetical protein HNV11_22855 [Spirosoma taeanense]